MYFLELFTSKEIPERDFLFFYEDFNCVFTQYEEKDGYKVEIIFSKRDDIDFFINFCNNSFDLKGNLLASLVENPTIKTFKSEEADNWIKFLPPVSVCSNYKIVSPWDSTRSIDEIVINPSIAFGTGHHETTSSCLELLLKIKHNLSSEEKIDSVLDIGTGSGILSIFCLKVFKSKIIGIDNDYNAIDQARKNLRLNPSLPNIDFRLEELDSINHTFDLIIANISIEYLLLNIHKMSERLNPNSFLLISGFLFMRISSMNFLLIKEKFSIMSIIHKNDWISMVIKKK
jgi:ribosomal protein L11 methyltransferase